MTAETWLTATLARRPPLSAAQIAALRPIFAPDMHTALAAETRAVTEKEEPPTTERLPVNA